ncbi:MAG: hypothetical protein AAF449_16220 [Myxococcota bacterium]
MGPVAAHADPGALKPRVVDWEVCFTPSDAERLLDVVERRLPAALSVIELERQRNELLALQVATATAGWALAEQGTDSSVFESPVLWTLVGVAAGVVVGVAVR